MLWDLFRLPACETGVRQPKGHIKATQGLLRHARWPTTGNVYQQILPEGVAEMVDSMHGELRKPSAAATETNLIAAKLRAKNENAELPPNRSRAIPDRLV